MGTFTLECIRATRTISGFQLFSWEGRTPVPRRSSTLRCNLKKEVEVGQQTWTFRVHRRRDPHPLNGNINLVRRKQKKLKTPGGIGSVSKFTTSGRLPFSFSLCFFKTDRAPDERTFDDMEHPKLRSRCRKHASFFSFLKPGGERHQQQPVAVPRMRLEIGRVRRAGRRMLGSVGLWPVREYGTSRPGQSICKRHTRKSSPIACGEQLPAPRRGPR